MYCSRFKISAVLVLAMILISHSEISSAEAQQYASTERSSAAVGHYARARTLLVEALAEFEQANKLARPDLVFDAEEWRTNVISRAEELNQILDPQPRVTRSGIYVRANPTLIKRERERPPVMADGPKTTNYQGELERKKRLAAARARMSEKESTDKPLNVTVEPTASQQSPINQAQIPSKEVPAVKQPIAEVNVAPADVSAVQRKEEIEKEILNSISAEVGALENEEAEAVVIPGKGKTANELAVDEKSVAPVQQEDTAKKVIAAEEHEVSDDEAIAAAIEQALQKRLSELSSEDE